MKLVELLEQHPLIIQLIWGEQKIEFSSRVIERDESAIYVAPYFHNGSELELNIVQEKGVICNLFTDDPSTKQRISWRNVELTTVTREDKILYCLKTSAYNTMATQDDRRAHDRLIIQTNAHVYEGQSETGTSVLVHDISDIGISFYAPNSFSPKETLLTVVFTDTIEEKTFNIHVECTITRMTNRAGNRFVGCKIRSGNKDFQLYGFMKRLKDKNRNRAGL